jgi:Holliday junction DNA helicase RuvA
MIAMLRGEVIEHEGSAVIIDCSGVGYLVTVCGDDQGILASGKTAVLYIAENIKEDLHDLYGFLAKSKKALYLQLTSVNGVGPKAAMAILAVASENDIRKAIAEGNTALLSRASGVGKKVAERIVVDLKSKVGLHASDDATGFLQDDVASQSDEAVQALVALGYSVNDATLALRGIDSSLPVETRIKQALRG